ncbi:MAG TPA: biotin--[acetyl-CoA-carboxylase] ligase [Acidimicrobiales bacterium]|nr:biotin--[acetyl-CoA-carboxylase] ligase [Acidimicrobiales bacterium]
MPGGRARSALAGTSGARFADVRWVAETGSTNADAMELARHGAPEGVVVVADHQTAGRGRAGRSWTAPPGASLLVSVLLRPPAGVAEGATMAMALAAAEAVEEVAGFAPGVKWPNDLVWPGDGSAPDRKLAGILAEADWPTGSSAASGVRRPAPEERVVVVVGIGINVAWPEDLPEELADVAVACNHVTDVPVDREDLLAALLVRLGHWYGRLVDGDRAALVAAWRERSATLGRRVRIDLGPDDVVGTAVDITERGHLVVDTLEGERRTFAVGDVVHLRPELA